MSYDRHHRSNRAAGRPGTDAGLPAVGKTTLTSLLVPLQKQAPAPSTGADRGASRSVADVEAAARDGVRGPGTALPYAHHIQALFGRHDVSGVRAHQGGEAAAACSAIGARAYAVGDDVAFAGPPDLHTAAHEAAHTVQQRGGVQLEGGIGEVGDRYEQNADAVADAVVAGRSAEALLDPLASGGAAHAVQRAPTAQQQPPATDEDRVADWFRRHWRGHADSKDLARRLPLYVRMEFSRLHLHPNLMVEARDKLHIRNPESLRAGYNRFADEVETQLLTDLLSSASFQATWHTFVDSYHEDLERDDRLLRFKQRVEQRLVESIANDAASSALNARPGGMNADQIRQLADVQVRAIVANHRQDYFTAVSNGVQMWRVPVSDPSAWPSVVSNASSVAGGIGSVITIGAALGSAVATAGIGLLVVGIGAGIHSAIMSYQSTPEASRMARVEAKIKEETLRGFERIQGGIEALEDVLAVLITTAAINERINVRSIARDELRRFAWRKMFDNELPQDATRLRTYVTQKMTNELDHHLGG